jgi:hypothetical protein
LSQQLSLKTWALFQQYSHCFYQCCGSEAERIRAFLAESESEIFVPDSDSDPDSDPVPYPVI